MKAIETRVPYGRFLMRVVLSLGVLYVLVVLLISLKRDLFELVTKRPHSLHSKDLCSQPLKFANLPATAPYGSVCKITDALACNENLAVTTGGGKQPCYVIRDLDHWHSFGDSRGHVLPNTRPPTYFPNGQPIPTPDCSQPLTFAELPTAPSYGQVCEITDALDCSVFLSIPVGGGEKTCTIVRYGKHWHEIADGQGRTLSTSPVVMPVPTD